MGNCIKPSTQMQHDGDDMDLFQEEKDLAAEFVKESGDFKKGAGLKVKIVLTKKELEWLMFQLKVNGEKKLEDVLGEIEKGRGKVKAWKPSLESIMESPGL